MDSALFASWAAERFWGRMACNCLWTFGLPRPIHSGQSRWQTCLEWRWWACRRERAEEQIEPNGQFLPLKTFDELDRDGAFVDRAAIMQHLDLVITSDTSVAHLAGALGRPVWVRLSTGCDWRWLVGRHDSLWYPNRMAPW